MNIVYKNLTEIRPYEKNPRKNKKAVDKVVASIEEFGFKNPIIIDQDGIIVAGHTRYLAATKLQLESVPCILADDLSDEQIKAFRLADNKTAEFAEWDFDLLDEELSEILNIDMEDFGFELGDLLDDEESNYTVKADIPQYTPKGEEPEFYEMVNTEKVDELLEEIEASNVTEDQKEFLRQAAQRHLGFNYKNIAEYYCHQDKEMQELMEKSALVIIDFNDAMKNGYIKMTKKLESIING